MGYAGYWRNCQWVRSAEARDMSLISEPADDSSSFGTDCQLSAYSSGTDSLVPYESDSSCDTGLFHIYSF